jgi:hypothetical protein
VQHHVQDELCVALVDHRSQGSTVERAHALEDGGGRELAYVKMSRARQCTRVYVVADSPAQAREDLAREWESERRIGWVIDLPGPASDPLSAERSPTVAPALRHALRRGRLVAEREAIRAVVPPDPTVHIRAAELARSRLQAEREDLAAGTGRYRDHPVAHALGQRNQAEANIARIEGILAGPRSPRATRRMWRSELAEWRSRHATADRAVEDLSAPEIARIHREERGLEERLSGLWTQRETHQRWAAEHPEASRRLDHLAADIDSLDARLDLRRVAHDRARVIEPRGVVLDRGLGIDL